MSLINFYLEPSLVSSVNVFITRFDIKGSIEPFLSHLSHKQKNKHSTIIYYLHCKLFIAFFIIYYFSIHVVLLGLLLIPVFLLF